VSRDRRPSYTDRILISPVSNNLKILQYSSMNDIKLSDHRPVFADIMLSQQSTDNKIPAKSVIIFFNHYSLVFLSLHLKNTNKNLSPKINIKKSSKKNPVIFIIIIIIIAIICIFIILAIYYFIIKRQTKQVDIQQTSSTDLVHS